ncbi:GTP-binding protein Rho1 [Serendipita sp. 399]|nr:GTP-binding protein Rho1 [Serendipita sp. 399]
MSAEVELWDTVDYEDYEQLRQMTYVDTHIVLICFSFDLPNSLQNAQYKWLPEVLHWCRDPSNGSVHYALVGCKKDIKGNGQLVETLSLTADQRLPTTENAKVAARQMGADMYLECSARTGEGIEDVIQQATRAAFLLNKRQASIPL